MRRLHINVKSALKAFELTYKTVFGAELLGNYKSLFRGTGLEFEGYAGYAPTDDSKLIDWKASLKANTLLKREYAEERNMNIFFLIGATGSMIFTTTDKLKAEYAGELIISLAHVMMQKNDLVGFAMFNNKIETIQPPSRDAAHFHNLITSVSNTDYYREGCDLTSVLDLAFNTLKPNSTIIIISDFIGLTPGWEQALKMAALKFEVMAIMVRDPADLALPETRNQLAALRSTSSNRIINVRLKSVRYKYTKYANDRILYFKKVFAECNADLLILTTDKPFTPPVLHFLAMRKHNKWK